MKRILAFDPAAERSNSDTGYAILEYQDDTPAQVVESGVIHGGFEGFTRWVNRNLSELAPNYVVCEHYVPYNKVADPSPLLIEGVIRYLWPDTALQPSTGKNSLVPNDKLKEWGLWKSAGHHADEREAIRHAFVYLVNQRHRPTLKLLSQ